MPQGLQGFMLFFTAHGLHGLADFFIAQGFAAHGFMAQGLAGFFMPQGLHGLLPAMAGALIMPIPSSIAAVIDSIRFIFSSIGFHLFRVGDYQSQAVIISYNKNKRPRF